jgi:fluoroquinolone transport system permease protein
VWRDPLLGWVLLLPLGLALGMRLVLPRVEALFVSGTGLDITPYLPLVMGGYLMTAPGIVGMVVGFLLLDERDARTLSALRVTPLSMRRYLSYRIGLPLLVGTASTLVGYRVTGLVPLPLAVLAPLAVVAGLSAPLLALVLGWAAPNKVAGFAVVKVLNGLNLLPVAAFFVLVPKQYAAGVLPSYWPMRALWSAAAGERYLAELGLGVIVACAWAALAAVAFDRRLRRKG